MRSVPGFLCGVMSTETNGGPISAAVQGGSMAHTPARRRIRAVAHQWLIPPSASKNEMADTPVRQKLKALSKEKRIVHTFFGIPHTTYRLAYASIKNKLKISI